MEILGLHKDMIGVGPLYPQHVTSFQQLPSTHEQRKKGNFPVGDRGKRVLNADPPRVCASPSTANVECLAFPLQLVLKS